MNTDTALLTVSQMSQADRLTTAAGLPSIELMENAGYAVTQEILRRFLPRRVSVLCGPGNNGGDGFVVARHLAEAGWPVRIALLGLRDHLKGAARHHAEQWLETIEPMTPSVLDNAELVIDALFGAGLDRALDGEAAETLAAAASLNLPIVAVDVPSGLMGDTGEVQGGVPAVLTVTFFRKKPGHLLLPGRMLCGEVVVADIGIEASTLTEIRPDTFENDPALWLDDMPWLDDEGNKYTRGHALICGGYPMTGGSRMAARAAARIGSGLTTIAVPEIAFPIYAAALTSIMVHPMVATKDVKLLLEDHRFTAFLVGPGCGVGMTTQDHALEILSTGLPIVLDADAITAFQDDPTLLDKAIVGPCILTPHDGEFRRLFDPTGDKLTRTRAAAHRSSAIIVLKGSDTVISAPDGRSIINTNAPSTLATAGAGDVLSGMVLGLLAQGMDPFLAAAAAVWIHGAAATEFGPGLIAEDLPDLLPSILGRLHFNN